MRNDDQPWVPAFAGLRRVLVHARRGLRSGRRRHLHRVELRAGLVAPGAHWRRRFGSGRRGELRGLQRLAVRPRRGPRGPVSGAALGTWVTRGPIGFADGMGLYEYLAGDPRWGLDPWGLWTVTIYQPDPGGGWWEITHEYEDSPWYNPFTSALGKYKKTTKRHIMVRPDCRGLDPRDVAGGPCSPEDAVKEKIQSDRDMLGAAEREIKYALKDYSPAAFIPAKFVPKGWQRMRPHGGHPTSRDPKRHSFHWDSQHRNRGK